MDKITKIEDDIITLDNGVEFKLGVFFVNKEAKYHLPKYMLGKECKITFIENKNIIVRLTGTDYIVGILLREEGECL